MIRELIFRYCGHHENNSTSNVGKGTERDTVNERDTTYHSAFHIKFVLVQSHEPNASVYSSTSRLLVSMHDLL